MTEFYFLVNYPFKTYSTQDIFLILCMAVWIACKVIQYAAVVLNLVKVVLKFL